MKSIVVDMTGMEEVTSQCLSGETAAGTNHSQHSQQMNKERSIRGRKPHKERDAAATHSQSNSARIPTSISVASVASSRRGNTSVASTQMSEMRRLLAEERSRGESSSPPALVRSHRGPESGEAALFSAEDNISHMSESCQQSTTQQLLLQRLQQAEEQTKQFQHEIIALTKQLTTSNEEMASTANEETPTKQDHTFLNHVRKQFGLEANSIVTTGSVQPTTNETTHPQEETQQEEEDKDKAKTDEIPNPAYSCSALEQCIPLLREWAGLPNPSDSSVVGLKVDQFKKDQMTKQKLRDLEQQNEHLRRTLQVVDRIRCEQSLPTMRRSCPARVVERETSDAEEDDVMEGPRIWMAPSNEGSNTSPDAILSLSTQSSKSHSSSVTMRPTKKFLPPPSPVATSAGGSVAEGSRISHESRLESVPENEELSTNVSTPPPTPPSEHNTRKYSLEELKQRSRKVRSSHSRNPPEARTATHDATNDGKRPQTRRFRIRGSKPGRSKPLDKSTWRKSFLERIEL